MDMMSIEDAERFEAARPPSAIIDDASEVDALEAIRQMGSVESVTALAALLRWERTKATRAVARWERDGLIVVKPAGPGLKTAIEYVEGGAERRQQSLNRLFVDMASEIVRSPYSVDERAAQLSWATVQLMRARKGAPL